MTMSKKSMNVVISTTKVMNFEQITTHGASSMTHTPPLLKSGKPLVLKYSAFSSVLSVVLHKLLEKILATAL